MSGTGTTPAHRCRWTELPSENCARLRKNPNSGQLNTSRLRAFGAELGEDRDELGDQSVGRHVVLVHSVEPIAGRATAEELRTDLDAGRCAEVCLCF